MSFQELPSSPPLTNIDRNLVNADSSTYAANFTSTTNPSTVNPNVLPVPSSNIQSAAASYVPSSKGGGKIRKSKINKISRKYKMKRSQKRHMKRTKSRLRSKYAAKSKARRASVARARRGGAHRSRKQRGGMPNYPAGYSQYQNNMPMTQTYSVGAPLASSESALANPPPIKTLDNCTNCVDNYNHNTAVGFPSRGWW
jgi:hypothetical protein